MPLCTSLLLAFLLLLHTLVLIRAMLVEDRDPYSRLAWAMAITLLPLVGIGAYAMLGEPWMSARFRRQANRVYKRLEQNEINADRRGKIAGPPERFILPFRTCESISQSCATGKNSVTLAKDANTAIDMIVCDIAAARNTVHLSFYIWLDDHNGTKVAVALKAAALRGVTCRVTADAIGSRVLIRSPLWSMMRDAGVRLCASLKPPAGLGLLSARRLDLRNHRKIVIIDNFITYCGSQNCADPEFLIKKKYAPWVDIMLRFEGPIAVQNQLIFASAWTVETGEDLTSFIASTPSQDASGDVTAVAFGTGPLSVKGAMSSVFVSLLYSANREVVVSTPYFVPDPPLLSALAACARRGVPTSLILPKHNDSHVIGAISRALYPQLLRAGVKIFEFRSGLLHAKTMVVDRTLSLVGSANMDRRSLELNFENNVLIFSPEVSEQIRERQDDYLGLSDEVDRASVDNRSRFHRLLQNSMTMASAIF